MTVRPRSLSEVTHDTIRLLSRELGVVETARFLSQFETGHGDYTKEREDLFEGVTLQELIEEARQFHVEQCA